MSPQLSLSNPRGSVAEALDHSSLGALCTAAQGDTEGRCHKEQVCLAHSTRAYMYRNYIGVVCFAVRGVSKFSYFYF